MVLLQPKNSLSLATVLFVAFTLIKVLAEESDNKTPDSQKREILETIKQIGSDNFKIRESATQKLWKFGRIAEPLLRDALKNGGPELRYRGTKILEEFELGLYPDTPEDIAKLINDYRSGVGVKKEAAIIKMAELGKTELLMKLIKRENDIGIRKMVAQIVGRNISEQVPALILENKIDEAGQLLEVAALDHNGMRNYASFLVESNQIESAITKKRIDAPKGNHWLVTIDWTFFNKEGDSYTSRCAGEAVDFGDKGLSKAVTASYKYFLFNALCIPLVGQEFGDADYDHPEDEFEDTDTKQAAPKKGPKKKTIAKTKLKAVEPSKPKVSLAVIQKQIEKDIGYKSICIKPSTHDEAGEFEITIEADLDKLREVTKKYMRKHPEQKGTLQGLTSGYAKAIELKEKRQKENDEREKQKAS